MIHLTMNQRPNAFNKAHLLNRRPEEKKGFAVCSRRQYECGVWDITEERYTGLYDQLEMNERKLGNFFLAQI